ncbi:ATP-dependent RNA helicase DHX29 [Brachyhypopomus gauderio]|uniref:ATP-dependent RNA helicase DHX29 n=1 Tax=Brachyhypopomus gauderio TaxID=698409 RepID=UPI0040418A0E
MGGKKKKASCASPAVPRSTEPATGNGGTPDPAIKKQQQRPNSTKAPAKENKAKVPKTYGLTNTSQVDTCGVSDKSILKVVIQPELEKKVIKLINDYKQGHGDKEPVSGRLTTKKLLDLYTALQKFHFKTEHIEEAMKSSVLYGGDLHSALDWLCLNLKDDELPEGFSQRMCEENDTGRPRFQEQKPDKSQPTLSREASNQEEKQRAKVREEAVNLKEWILRYAEQSSDESDREEARTADASQTPQPFEKFDPNDRYLVLTAQLYDARGMAADAKAKKDKTAQRSAQDRIRVIQQEMKPLESHPMFNPAIKITDVPKPEKPAARVTEANEELSFSLFEQTDKATPEKVEKKKEPKDIRNFDYTGRSWTGKSPKQFLIDWCRKNLPRSPAPSFQKVPAGRYWKCKVRIQRADDVLEVCPTIVTEDGMQAQHLGATLALYTLVKGQSVHQLLPPPYRDVWLEWRDSEQHQEEETRSAINKPRDQFIARLLARLKQQQLHNPQAHGQLESPPLTEEPEDSWESLATQEEAEPVSRGSGPQPEETGSRFKGRGSLPEEALRSLFLRLCDSEQAHRMRSEREKLPVFQQRARVLEALQRHRVLVVAGETGSGKSTQVPQFILEELLGAGQEAQPCNVVVTQPRRISAMSLASRVSEEMGCEDGPGAKTSLCGYQIRAESRSSEATRLLYCTTGVLLRKLQQDRLLTTFTHVIVDEVHERSVQSDFLLTILRDLVQKRSDLHLLLMSATADCGKFARYFNHCPVLTISGRTFPVQVFHLEDVVEATGYVLDQDSEYSQRSVEDEEEVSVLVTQKGGRTVQHQETIVRDADPSWDLGSDLDLFSSRTRHALQHMNPNKINMDLTLDLLAYLDKAPQFGTVDGAVLVFLPGLAHIQQLYDLLTTDKRFSSKDRYMLVALHSTLSSQDQAAAFRVPPSGVRKIVLSTNIAETGVTIPDVVFVIDTGKTKENRYHEGSQMSSLVETFVSKASALQRQGRAGRVRNGFCFRLYPKSKFISFNEYSKPEILRVPLEELCLHIMKCEYGSPEDFLSRALDPPLQQAVCNAVSLLRKIGACHRESHTLTPLGHHLACLPVNVKIGKMLIFGAILGCLEPIATIAAAISEKSPFTTPMSRKEEANLAKDSLAIANSDHLTIYNAYLGWQRARREGMRSEMAYCRTHFLSRTSLITIENVKQELVQMVEQTGFSSTSTVLPGGRRRRGEAQCPISLPKQNIPVLVAVLTAGLYDSVGRVLATPSVDPQERVVCMVDTAQGKAQVHPSSVNRTLHTHGWLLFQEKVKYSKVYLRDTTLVSPFPILLFGGDIDVQHRERLTSVDGWILFQAPVRIGVIFKHLRQLMDSLLEQKLANPRMHMEDEKTIQLITELIQSENLR